jgi:hypothetical protein
MLTNPISQRKHPPSSTAARPRYVFVLSCFRDEELVFRFDHHPEEFFSTAVDALTRSGHNILSALPPAARLPEVSLES